MFCLLIGQVEGKALPEGGHLGLQQLARLKNDLVNFICMGEKQFEEKKTTTKNKQYFALAIYDTACMEFDERTAGKKELHHRPTCILWKLHSLGGGGKIILGTMDPHYSGPLN